MDELDLKQWLKGLHLPLLILGWSEDGDKKGIASYWLPSLESALTQREREDLEKHLDRVSRLIFSVMVREAAKRK